MYVCMHVCTSKKCFSVYVNMNIDINVRIIYVFKFLYINM